MDMDDFHPRELDAVGSALSEQLGAGNVRATIQSRADEIAELVGCEVGDGTFERLLIALTVTFKVTAGVLDPEKRAKLHALRKSLTALDPAWLREATGIDADSAVPLLDAQLGAGRPHTGPRQFLVSALAEIFHRHAERLEATADHDLDEDRPLDVAGDYRERLKGFLTLMLTTFNIEIPSDQMLDRWIPAAYKR